MTFQMACIERLCQVLAKHGKDGAFVHRRNGLDRFTASFELEGKTYEIGVYAETVTMWQGKSLFEAYMPEELVSDEALIEGFATRLDRFLSGGPWEGPGEKGFPDLVRNRIRKIVKGS